MLSMETKAQQAPGNAQVIPNKNNPGQASAESTAQTGHSGAGDWQEEIYQMIKSLKDQYFAQLGELYNELSVKLQHVPPQKPSKEYERMKNFKKMLERILKILQLSKSTIQPALRHKVPQYKKQIISILNSQRRKPVQPRVQQQFQQRPPSQSWQRQNSHTNPQASLSSMSTTLQSSNAAVFRHVPTPPTTNFSVPTQQNDANLQWQAGRAQRSNFNSLQAVQPQVPRRFQPPAGHTYNSNISQQQRPSQSLQQHGSHTNAPASLSRMSTGLQYSSGPVFQHVHAPPTTNFSVPTQRHGANIQRQVGSNSEAAQGSNFNSLQYGSMGGALQQGSTWPMQGTMNAQLQTSSSMLSHNTMGTAQPNANPMQANAREQRKDMPKRSWSDAF